MGDAVWFTPGHHGVDQSVAPAPGEIVISEAQRAEIVGVVREGEIAGRECPGRLSRRVLRPSPAPR